jgi:hypothetical protein
MLAILGFVVFQLLRGRTSGRITSEIVAKLRNDVPADADRLKGLRPAQLERRIAGDQTLKRHVDKQDFKLLQQALHQEFITSLVVNILAAILFIVGVAMFVYQSTRPKPLGVSSIHVESDVTEAQGWAVDLDPIKVTWHADGEPTDVDVFLEHTQTGQRSGKVRVRASAGAVVIAPSDYSSILADRKKGASNAVRAVVQGPRSSFTSENVELRIGITVMVLATLDDGSHKGRLKVAALIDRSSIPFYSFKARIALFKKKAVADGVTFGDEMIYGKSSFTVGEPTKIDWDRLRIIYFGPDDNRLIRFETVIDDNLKMAQN